MEYLSYGLLLEDTVGYKKLDTLRSGRPSITYRKQKITKGTLLVTSPHEESQNVASHLNHVHKYKPLGEMGVSLYCDAHQVYQITRKQRDMLFGIRKLENRVEELHKLDWVCNLNFGSSVYVTIPTIPTPVRGVIRYVGKICGQLGKMFGVELMVCVYVISDVIYSSSNIS